MSDGLPLIPSEYINAEILPTRDIPLGGPESDASTLPPPEQQAMCKGEDGAEPLPKGISVQATLFAEDEDEDEDKDKDGKGMSGCCGKCCKGKYVFNMAVPPGDSSRVIQLVKEDMERMHKLRKRRAKIDELYRLVALYNEQGRSEREIRNLTTEIEVLVFHMHNW